MQLAVRFIMRCSERRNPSPRCSSTSSVITPARGPPRHAVLVGGRYGSGGLLFISRRNRLQDTTAAPGRPVAAPGRPFNQRGWGRRSGQERGCEQCRIGSYWCRTGQVSRCFQGSGWFKGWSPVRFPPQASVSLFSGLWASVWAQTVRLWTRSGPLLLTAAALAGDSSSPCMDVPWITSSWGEASATA